MTDSLYISAPEPEFVELDKAYYSGKISKNDYWTRMVEHTFDSIKAIQNDVNVMFISDNGTKFLKMAFEEVLYPMLLAAKKKYVGISHETKESINFAPKDMFIRGLEVKKRGVSDLAKKVIMSILWKCMNQTNDMTVIEAVEQKITDIYQNQAQWAFEDFIMTDVYKPNKKNVKVQTFARRMNSEGCPVKPYERFNYIIVKKYPFYYDYRGRKVELSIGDKMELFETAQNRHLSVDFDYYMKGSINGQLARLIVYHQKFQVDPTSDTDEDIKIAEDKIYNEACKYIEQYCSKYYTTYQSKGSIYQHIFRDVNNLVGKKLQEHHKDPTFIKLLKSCCDPDDIEGWLCKKAESEATAASKNYGEKYINGELEKIQIDEKIRQKIQDEYMAAEPPSDSENDDDDDDNNDDESAVKHAKNYKNKQQALIKAKRDAREQKINDLQRVYYGGNENLIKTREKDFKERIIILRRKIKDNLGNILKIHEAHTSMIVQVSEIIKSTLKIDDKYNNPNDKVPSYDNLENVDKLGNLTEKNKLEAEANAIVERFAKNAAFKSYIADLKILYANIISTYELWFKTKSIADYLKSLKPSKIIETPVSVTNLITELVKKEL